MNAIPEQYIDASKEFRAYMRTHKGEKGQFLSNLMDGAEVHLTKIIQSGIDATFTILYDESLTIEQLVREQRYKQALMEGNVIESHYDRRKRDHNARQKCIEHYDCKCAICGFDFEAQYGDVGKDFIEVHHIAPISSRKGEHDVDPIYDLIPVCSNCHSILHRRRPEPYLPEDVRLMLKH